MSKVEKEIILEDKMLNLLVSCINNKNNKNNKCKHDTSIRCEGIELCNLSAYELIRKLSK